MVDSEAEAELFLEKAGEALAGAESEFVNGRRTRQFLEAIQAGGGERG